MGEDDMTFRIACMASLLLFSLVAAAQDLERLLEIREQIAQRAAAGDAAQQKRLERIDDIIAERSKSKGMGARTDDQERLVERGTQEARMLSSELTPDAVWAGLWEGDIRIQNIFLRVQMALGARSWIDFAGQCLADLRPVSISDRTAVFDFEPVSGVCQSPGKLHIDLREYRGGGFELRGQSIGQVRVQAGSFDYRALLTSPITEVTESPYRFLQDDDGKWRFPWREPDLSAAQALAKAEEQGYKCIFSENLSLYDRQIARISHENNGNLANGFLYLLACEGNCADVIYGVETPNYNPYVQYYEDAFGTPAFLFETKNFFTRENAISWRLAPKFDTGRVENADARVHVAVLSRDSLDYGPGCSAPFSG
jgi:hypothetical protein